MALKKTAKEIAVMRQGGKILSQALTQVIAAVRPGVAIVELDRLAELSLREKGGEPSFLNYRSAHDFPAFPSSLCVSINEEVVHGPASRDRKLHEGDIVGLDLGCLYRGLFTDMAVTVPVGQVTDDVWRLIATTRQALLAAAAAVRIDGSIADIGQAVEKVVIPVGYGIVRQLVGHGVGYAVHEPPNIPNFYDQHSVKQKIVEGECLAIEPMITMGDWRVKTGDDGWTVTTVDNSWAAHFEVTVAATKSGPEILTPLPV